MIKKVLEDFIKVWTAYEGNNLELGDAVKRINSGDCGLTAIAVHHVLKHKYGIETTVLLNRNHCWLHFGGKDYDSMAVNGYANSANEAWSEKGDPNPVHELTFKEACDEWMPCDTYGGYLVKAFVERYGLTLPTELQHCIDNAEEYEGEQGIPAILVRYESAKAIPL
ncbi:hypothetical protein OBP_078 [Pseudomonas phage OBP]|uniref:hypothetical protein n=1 Tax=Pseudomonas phage OBP TaxID=1124849 RepID=UPI000240D42C|nr:hypothetical protein OBP_078 [Pseudomonas phage OBP]AEV89515.1 hypothetical protein OBP_078 [Pseudomonas phage OBP]